jgi:hypothetical protein
MCVALLGCATSIRPIRSARPPGGDWRLLVSIDREVLVCLSIEYNTSHRAFLEAVAERGNRDVLLEGTRVFVLVEGEHDRLIDPSEADIRTAISEEAHAVRVETPAGRARAAEAARAPAALKIAN